jgi:hypothetical protein
MEAMDYYTPENRTYTMIDRTNVSFLQVPTKFIATTPSVANFTHVGPQAYSSRKAWADVAEGLEILGAQGPNLGL